MKRINETKDVTVTARKAEKIQEESGKRKAEMAVPREKSCLRGLKITQSRDKMKGDVTQK